MDKTVSIIIPTFNRAHLIGETLNSVQAQSYQNWECIIVDDGSKDKTKNVVASFITNDKRFSLYSRPDIRKKGPSACRNIGIEKAVGEYVVFLDSDDLLSISCLEDRLNFISNNSNYDFWVFKMQEFNKETYGRIYDFDAFKDDNIILEYFLESKIPFTVTSPLWKTEDLRLIDGFDEDFLRLEDPEMHIRMLFNGKKPGLNYEQIYPDSFYRKRNVLNEKYSKSKYKEIIDDFTKFIIKINLVYQNKKIFFSKERYNQCIEKTTTKVIWKYAIPSKNIWLLKKILQNSSFRLYMIFKFIIFFYYNILDFTKGRYFLKSILFKDK